MDAQTVAPPADPMTSGPAVAEFDRPMLIEALRNACAVVTKPLKKASRPEITEYVLIRRSGIGVSVTATDFDRVTSSFVYGSCPDDFIAALPAKRLLTCLKSQSAARTVTLTLTGTSATVEIGAVSFHLAAHSEPAQFPLELPFQKTLAESKQAFILPRSVLLPILERSRHAQSKDPARYYLGGLCLMERDGKLISVTTDGHRLVRWQGQSPAGSGGMPDTIIPASVIHELHRMLSRKGAADDIMVTVADQAISFLIGEDEILETRAVDGTFPDFDRVIPPAADQVISFDPHRMIEAITAISCLDPAKKAVALAFHETGIDVCLGQTHECQAKTTLAADLTGIEPVTVGVNRSYLKDILSTITGRCRIGINDPREAIRLSDTAVEGFTYVLMPLRV